MTLYGYWRSTAAFRVRIALNLKGQHYDTMPVDLAAGAQHGRAYAGVTPSGLVPALALDDGTVLTQSLAIIDWLEARFPQPALFPADPLLRARVLAMAQVIASDIHPVNNLRVVSQLEARFGASAADKADWMRYWMRLGFDTLQGQVSDDTLFALTDTPSIADICLVAQLYNARRWGLKLAAYPRLLQIEAAAYRLSAFQLAAPEAQPDHHLN